MFLLKHYRIFLISLILLVGCHSEQRKEEVANDTTVITQNENEWSGKVVKITDGDTIEVLLNGKAVKIRLADIDCPEKRQAFGTRAKQYTADLCFGKIVKVVKVGTDRYQRIIGTVYLDNGTVLNKELLKVGLAWFYKKYSDKQDYADLENEARQNKVGLWADDEPTPPWEFRHH